MDDAKMVVSKVSLQAECPPIFCFVLAGGMHEDINTRCLDIAAAPWSERWWAFARFARAGGAPPRWVSPHPRRLARWESPPPGPPARGAPPPQDSRLVKDNIKFIVNPPGAGGGAC